MSPFFGRLHSGCVFRLLPAVLVTAVLVASPVALAYYTTVGSGSATGTVATLKAPSISTATTGAGTVTLSWNAVAAPAAGVVKYYVLRDGGLPAGDCPTASQQSTVTSCADGSVALGMHQYKVVAIWKSWTSTSEAKQVEVAKLSQAIRFTSAAPSGAAVGGPAYMVTAEGGASGNPVTFAIDATSSSVCSISGSTISFTGVGTCTIDANQVGGAYYKAASQAQQSFAVGKGSQTIAFTSTAPASATIGGSTYTVTATGGASGNPVTFAIDATSSSVCSISGSTISFIGAGTCTIDASQMGNASYNPAAQAQQSFLVSATALTVLKVIRDGGKDKVDFAGTGGTAGATIVVTVCKVNPSPGSCTAGNIVATASTATSPGAIKADGAWQTGQDTNNLEAGATYWAQATQSAPIKTSAVFQFLAP